MSLHLEQAGFADLLLFFDSKIKPPVLHEQLAKRRRRRWTE
jgi:hypothetical protein